jgi:peptidyl-prolyl cis-trans isomerase A (cyclophilin A)
MSEISHVRPLALACSLALAACADAGKSDAPKTAPAPTKTEAKVETKVETKTETKTVETKTEPPAQPQTPAQPAAKYKKGQLAPPGLKPDELLEYNKAQGDPMGSITLEQALAGDDALADKTRGKLFATFDTTQGKFRCELFEDKVPNTVANFVGLARGIRPYYVKKDDAWKTGKFYDGTLFHRVIDGFMIQGGDPLGTGTGGPGFLVVDEFDKTLRHTGPGILSMANRGPNTGSSQFFVTVGATPHLDDKHAIFGKCEPKVPVAISKVKTRADRPLDDVKITSLTFERAKK